MSGGCVLPPGHSPELQLQVTAGPRVLATWGPSPLGFTWNVSEEDNGTEVLCEARMPASKKNPKKSVPVVLIVTGGCTGGSQGGGGDIAAHFRWE